MKAHRFLFLALICCTSSFVTQSAEVVVDGTAIVRGGDQGQARELAIRRALSRAAESQGAFVNSQSVVHPGRVLESIQVRATAFVGNSQVIGEKIHNNELTVTMKVAVNDVVSESAPCQSNYVNKVVVVDFGFEFSDQMLPSEKSIFKYKTAGEIARVIRKRERLQVAYENMRFPYFSASSAPEPFVSKPDNGNPFTKIADSHRAQYILAGVYRDFGLMAGLDNHQSRRIEIEAFLHDGANGSLLDRKTFTASATGVVTLSDNPPLGSPLFYQTDFGRVWGGVLDDIARWADEKISCMPFVSRVVKTEGQKIYIDSGKNSGFSSGDTLNVHVLREPEIRRVENLYLETENELHATASLVSVYPDFSVLEINENSEMIERVRAGDLVYSR